MDKREKRINTEALPGVLLIVATIIALIVANTGLNSIYDKLIYDTEIIAGLNVHEIINDFLMAIFFLVVGLEIKREFVLGNLSNIKDALFPITAAIGGMVFPALIYYVININSGFLKGMGIPISTDIAFAIGIFSILQSKMNSKLKVFLLTLAVVDDLLSIVVIAIFYSEEINKTAIFIAIIITCILFLLNKFKSKYVVYLYAIIGFALWIAVFKSGIHSTISGVILAISIPVSKNHQEDLNEKMKEALEPLVNYVILPLFAFSNTGIDLHINLDIAKNYPLMLGIILGLVIGKPLGIMSFSYIGEKVGILKRPKKVTWLEILPAGMLAGIGYTMAIFVAQIAFMGHQQELEISKISILLALVISITLTYIVVNITSKKANL